MAKNRNKKNKTGSAPMDVVSDNHTTSSIVPEAMDTSESTATRSSSGGSIIKAKRGVQMKRSKNVRKMKAIAKAISKGEKKEVKIMKNESKKQRTKSAKNLYD